MPAKGFAPTYQAMCDYFNVRVRNDLVWDFNNIYGPKNVREFNVAEFDSLEPHDLKALCGALPLNDHFTRFIARRYDAQPKEFVAWLASIVARNNSIEDVEVPHNKFGKELLAVIEAWQANKRTAIVRVDLSNNGAEDKTFIALAAVLEKLPVCFFADCFFFRLSVFDVSVLQHGMIRMDVSNNAATSKGTTAIGIFLY